MDRWLEEDEEVFVHARDPQKRVDITMSNREVEVVLGGETVARSSGAMFLFETDLPTRYYLPADDVRMDLLTPSDIRTQCPYKGEAVYWNAIIGGRHLGGHCLELPRTGRGIGSYPRPALFLQ